MHRLTCLTCRTPGYIGLQRAELFGPWDLFYGPERLKSAGRVGVGRQDSKVRKALTALQGNNISSLKRERECKCLAAVQEARRVKNVARCEVIFLKAIVNVLGGVFMSALMQMRV